MANVRAPIGTHSKGRGKIAYWPDWVLAECQRRIRARSNMVELNEPNFRSDGVMFQALKDAKKDAINKAFGFCVTNSSGQLNKLEDFVVAFCTQVMLIEYVYTE